MQGLTESFNQNCTNRCFIQMDGQRKSIILLTITIPNFHIEIADRRLSLVYTCDPVELRRSLSVRRRRALGSQSMSRSINTLSVKPTNFHTPV